MTKSSDITPLLEQFKLFLRSTDKMSEDEIDVYVLGLRNDIITSTDVEGNIPKLRLTTAGAILKRLSNAGFFKYMPDSENSKKGGRGRVKKYKVVPPGTALRSTIEEQERVTKVIEKIDEHLESSEGGNIDDELWVTRPEDTAISTFASRIEKALRTVKIYSHDCSWANVPKIMEAVRNCKYRNVPVYVVCTGAGKSEKEILKKRGLKLNRTNIHTLPFVVIDDYLLLMPYKCTGLSSRYSLMETQNKYWVESKKRLFETLYNERKNKGVHSLT